MARPQVPDRGDTLQIWRVAANITNKHSLTADKCGPPASGLGVVLRTYTEIRWGGVRWINLAQNMDRWKALVNIVIKLQVS
jgi:hypothetical protein